MQKVEFKIEFWEIVLGGLGILGVLGDLRGRVKDATAQDRTTAQDNNSTTAQDNDRVTL